MRFQYESKLMDVNPLEPKELKIGVLTGLRYSAKSCLSANFTMQKVRFRFSNYWLPSVWSSVLVFVSLGVCAADTTVVRHNFYDDQKSETLNYKGEVLALILEKSKAKYGPYVMKKGPQIDWSQSRAYSQLERGELDLIASQTSHAREQAGLPVRYCLYKGLLGIRIGMGTRDTVAALERMQNRAELDRVKLGQVFDWPDYAIQTEAGLQVVRLTNVASSIERLKSGSFQLLPLGIVEVAPIAQKYGLHTVSTWAIAYPTAYYFFVTKKRPELAERLSYGFEQAIRDGSFDALFARRLEPLVAAAGLQKRKLFRIENPYLPAATPLGRKELWHSLLSTVLQ